jgi:hypothetical protein
LAVKKRINCNTMVQNCGVTRPSIFSQLIAIRRVGSLVRRLP